MRGTERRTYAEFAARVSAAAELLHGLGVRRGARVAFHGRNEPVALDTLFAAAALGAVWVPIHPARPEDEVRFILDDSEAAALVRGSADTFPIGPWPTLDAGELAAAQVGPGASLPPPVPTSPDELAVLAYTSGTTGAPKGVMLTHANITWNVVHMLGACAISRADVVLGAAPFTRMGGIGVTVLEALFVGATVVIPETVDGPGVLSTIVDQRITLLFANPDLLQAMVDSPGWEGADLSSIRTGVVGGGLVPDELLHRYLDRGVLLRHGYGLTEAAPVVTMLDERDAVSRSRSVGKVVGFVEAKTIREDGEDCATGETGELIVRGPNVTAGYWRRPDATAAATVSGGWFRTGDAAWIDEDGYVTLVDRVRDAIDVGSRRLYPAELERALYRAPGIVDVAAIALRGEIVIAILPAPGAAVDAAAVRLRLRAQLPEGSSCTVRIVDRIPRNVAGKILRDELRRRLEAAEPPARG